MASEEDRRVDEFYASPSLRQFNYAECTDCHHFIELVNGRSVSELAQDDVNKWKFSLMGLRKSVLQVAKGICPVCQQMRKQFKGILEA